MTSLFIVGAGRSGTTLLARMLDRHPRIFSFHELHFFEEAASGAEAGRCLDNSAAEALVANLYTVQIDGYLNRRQPEKYSVQARTLVASVPAAERTPVTLFMAFLRYFARTEGADIPVEQTPRNMFYAREILDAYPDARIVELVRDPRDVLASMRHKWRRIYLADSYPIREGLRAWANYHPAVAARLWLANVRHGNTLEEHERYTRIRYEDLVADPEGTLTRLCRLLGVEFDEDMLAVEQKGSSADRDTGRSGVSAEHVGRWCERLPAADTWLCERVAGNAMRDWDYRPSAMPMPVISVAFSLVLLPIKLGLALALNMKRVKSLRDFAARRFAAVAPGSGPER